MNTLELQFRIWDKKLKVWINKDMFHLTFYGNLVLLCPDNELDLLEIPLNGDGRFEVSQYIGRIDHNGNKAFFGDWITCDTIALKDDRAVIAYNNTGWWVQAKDGSFQMPHQFTIVGNEWEGLIQPEAQSQAAKDKDLRFFDFKDLIHTWERKLVSKQKYADASFFRELSRIIEEEQGTAHPFVVDTSGLRECRIELDEEARKNANNKPQPDAAVGHKKPSGFNFPMPEGVVNLSEEKIIKGNTLLGTFMNYYEAASAYCRMHNIDYVWENDVTEIRSLRYPSSWDWLIPVWSKWSQLINAERMNIRGKHPDHELFREVELNFKMAMFENSVEKAFEVMVDGVTLLNELVVR